VKGFKYNNLGGPTKVGPPFLLPAARAKNLRTQVFYRTQAQPLDLPAGSDNSGPQPQPATFPLISW
jgi:hypothetical protein